MTRIKILFVCISVALATLLTTASAYATNDNSWVASYGSGTACTRTAPCNSVATAVAATYTGGVVSVLDPFVDISTVTIDRSITIRAEGVYGAYSVSGAATGTWITINAATTDVVTLEGLHFNGIGGVTANSVGQLHIVRCVFANAINSGDIGIRFRPNSPSKLSVTDTVVTNVGKTTGGGIVVSPQAGGSAQVALKRVTVDGNLFGIVADGTGSTAGINMTIADSIVANNVKDGIIATSPGGGAPIGVYVKNTQTANNAFGIRSIGNNVTVRADGSSVIGNSTGLSFSGGGALLSFGNNAVRANGSDGAFSGPVGLQ